MTAKAGDEEPKLRRMTAAELALEVDGYPECLRDRVIAVVVSADGRSARVTLAPKEAT